MANTFNVALLRLARQYRHASQSDVARQAGMDQSNYSRIENDLVSEGPTAKQVEKIARALNFQPGFFYQDDGLAGLPLSVHPFNRKKATFSERGLKQIHAELNIRLIHLRRFLRAVEIKPQLPLPYLNDGEQESPQEVARAIRRAWALLEGPIANLADCCERAGIIVIWCEFAKGIDGVTMKVRDLPPCVFLNKNSPPDRMRFSLAHELGHIIMHTQQTTATLSSSIEDEANAFASELLVPEKQFRKIAIGHKITLEWLARQKAYWKVSMAALLYVAGEQNILSHNGKQYLWKKLSARGWRIREPEETDFPYERPTVFPSIVRMHAEELKYDMASLENLLNMGRAELHGFYGAYLSSGHLYIIK